jgi:hypothetical protein
MIIGTIDSAKKLDVDLPRLVDTRLLIQANSGGGKSWLLRLIAERAGIQTVVLDPEGEFASLREAVDVLLIGREGEIPADPRSAGLLARRLLEYKVSAVIDLFDLRLSERRRFVRLFLESLLHLSRELWHPALVILDEAHLYCPERSAGEAESTEAVIALMSQGRKRGLCGIIATQRLSKLHKDAAAETNNVIIGRTWLDGDQQRAGDLLGMGKPERLKLRDLEQGEFYAFGPALNFPGVVHFRSAQVSTTHPKPGARHLLSAPAPSKAIRTVLAKMADLPKQAEEEARDVSEARRQIAELKRELAEARRGRAPVVDQGAIDRAVRVAVIEERQRFNTFRTQTEKRFRWIAGNVVRLERVFVSAGEIVGAMRSDGDWDRNSSSGVPQEVPVLKVPSPRVPTPGKMTTSVRGARSNGAHSPAVGNDNGKLASGERKILTVLAQYPEGRTKVQVAVLTGYAVSGGGFNNYLGGLRSRGFIAGGGEQLRVTEAGLEALGSWDPLPVGPELIEYWRRQLGKAERLILEALMNAYPSALNKADIAAQTGYEANGGGFNNALGRLRTLELIEGRGELRISGNLIG